MALSREPLCESFDLTIERGRKMAHSDKVAHHLTEVKYSNTKTNRRAYSKAARRAAKNEIRNRQGGEK